MIESDVLLGLKTSRTSFQSLRKSISLRELLYPVPSVPTGNLTWSFGSLVLLYSTTICWILFNIAVVSLRLNDLESSNVLIKLGITSRLSSITVSTSEDLVNVPGEVNTDCKAALICAVSCFPLNANLSEVIDLRKNPIFCSSSIVLPRPLGLNTYISSPILIIGESSPISSSQNLCVILRYSLAFFISVEPSRAPPVCLTLINKKLFKSLASLSLKFSRTAFNPAIFPSDKSLSSTV